MVSEKLSQRENRTESVFEAVAAISEALEGNVRELQNIIEQAYLIAGKGMIEVRHSASRASLSQTVASAENARTSLMWQVSPAD